MKLSIASFAVLATTALTAIPSTSSSLSLSALSQADVTSLLADWRLQGAFGDAFSKHEIDGTALMYLKKDRLDAQAFAPSAQPFQWDMLWDQLTPLQEQHAKQVHCFIVGLFLL